MKQFHTTIVVFLLASASLYAQSKTKIQEVKEQMWLQAEDEFRSTTINTKYANESAVVICQKLEYEVRKEVFLTYLYENTFLHRRVKLLDKSAVEEFSELEFNFTNSYIPGGFRMNYENYVGIKIVKPDGSEREIDVEDAVSETLQQSYQTYKVKKFAIPDLEPGDIIDYYFVTKHITLNNILEIFDPWLYRLSGEYPIQKHYVELRTLRKCFLNVTTLNGAPRFTQINEKGDATTFRLSMKDIEKEENKRWLYPYREYPTIKFQAYYFSSKGKAQAPMIYRFVDSKNQIREKFTKQEMSELLYYLASNWPANNIDLASEIMSLIFEPTDDFGKMVAHLKDNFPKEKDPEVLIRETVYYYRQLKFRSGFMNDNLYEDNTTENRELKGEPDYSGDYETVQMISKVLKYKKIPHKLFLTVANNYGTVDDFLIPLDVSMGIVVHGKEDRYISSVNRFSTFGEIPTEMHGNRAISIDPYVSKSKRGFVEITLPGSTSEYTVFKTLSRVNIDTETMDSLFISREVAVSGYGRYYYQNNFMTPEEYLDACRDDHFRFKKSEKKKDIARAEQKNKQDQEDRIERYRKELLTEYHIDEVKVKAFTLQKSGMWDDDPAFVYKDAFSINDFISRVGPNYLVEIGELIGGQITLTDKEQEGRDAAIYLTIPRQFHETVELTIPEGYEPQGIEDLNISVSNEAGKFEAKAEFSNGILKVTTVKTYAKTYLPADQWNLMIKFLNVSYAFTQKKVLLQKI